MYSFFDILQADRYLRDTIIMYKKTPFYVTGVLDGGGGKDFLAVGKKLGESKSLTLPLDDKDLSYKPISLGMIPVTDKDLYAYSGFACRMPLRQWKIGLAANNYSVYAADGKDHLVIFWTWNVFLKYDNLKNCITNNYPSFEACRKLLKDNDKVVTAFSKHWAMSDKSLYYKATGKPVGDVTDDSVTLHENYAFLQELLDEATA